MGFAGLVEKLYIAKIGIFDNGKFLETLNQSHSNAHMCGVM